MASFKKLVRDESALFSELLDRTRAYIAKDHTFCQRPSQKGAGLPYDQ